MPPFSDAVDSAAVPQAEGAGPTILIYFSRAGENYYYGGRETVEVGNTARLVELIVARLGCPSYEIRAADEYSDDYADTVARNVREQDDDARPLIANALPLLDGFDTVILASPIWNVRPPMIMSTLVESMNMKGKTILPVTTHAMSGLGRAPEVYQMLAPEAIVGEGLAVRGEEVADAGQAIDEWIAAAGLATR